MNKGLGEKKRNLFDDQSSVTDCFQPIVLTLPSLGPAALACSYLSPSGVGSQLDMESPLGHTHSSRDRVGHSQGKFSGK